MLDCVARVLSPLAARGHWLGSFLLRRPTRPRASASFREPRRPPSVPFPEPGSRAAGDPQRAGVRRHPPSRTASRGGRGAVHPAPVGGRPAAARPRLPRSRDRGGGVARRGGGRARGVRRPRAAVRRGGRQARPRGLQPSTEGTYRERKARLRAAVAAAEGNAVTIFAADKVAKTRELRMRIARTPDHAPDPQKLEHYWASLELLETRLGHHPLVRQLRFELEALAVLPRPSRRCVALIRRRRRAPRSPRR